MTEPNNHPVELLAAAADDTLSPVDRATLDAHLAACEQCRIELAEARTAKAALG